MTATVKSAEKELKWKEVYSLAALNAAVVISWIAYHEYQPVLIEKFEFSSLRSFLLVAQSIILVTIPPVAGLLADRIMRRSGKFFTIFTIGIGATAMVFMVVATIIGAGPLSAVKPLLPFMIVIWLISMNLFISPANSMIEAFAPAHKLPVVMGVLFLVTELLYALEPVIVSLVHIFGDTLTFVVGGILIAGTGFLFHKVSSDEVIQRKQELIESPKIMKQSVMSYVTILVIGLVLGVGKGFLVEYVPDHIETNFKSIGQYGGYISFGFLGFSAILAFAISNYVSKQRLQNVIILGFAVLVIGLVLLLVSSSVVVLIAGCLFTAIAFSFINIAGLPFAINNLSVNHLTYGVGIYIGASEVCTSVFELIQG